MNLFYNRSAAAAAKPDGDSWVSLRSQLICMHAYRRMYQQANTLLDDAYILRTYLQVHVMYKVWAGLLNIASTYT